LVLHGFIITWPIGYYEIPLDEISEQSPLYIATAMQITGAATPILLASPALESYSIMLVLHSKEISFTDLTPDELNKALLRWLQVIQALFR